MTIPLKNICREPGNTEEIKMTRQVVGQSGINIVGKDNLMSEQKKSKILKVVYGKLTRLP